MTDNLFSRVLSNIGKDPYPVAVIDVETSQGFDVDYQPICAIAICHIEIDGTIKTPMKFLVQPPNNEISEDTAAIHGITPEMTKDAPDFAARWHEITELIKGRILAAHNADFDFKVIEAEMQKANISPPANSYVCTLDIAREVFPNLEKHGLAFLTEEFDIELDHHDPASDAKATAELLKIMMKCGKRENPVNLSEKYRVPVGVFGFPPRWDEGMKKWERDPHFKKIRGRWAVCASKGVLFEGAVVSVKKKSGETSVVKIGTELEEIKASAGGTLIASMNYADVSDNPQIEDLQDYEG